MLVSQLYSASSWDFEAWVLWEWRLFDWTIGF